ncbi:MAG: hypothetical protein QE271_01375 [Bacteriovoracaceae bacterium]|nr:hypothetical protein [Bacteriovoracaceae bacterium]
MLRSYLSPFIISSILISSSPTFIHASPPPEDFDVKYKKSQTLIGDQEYSTAEESSKLQTKLQVAQMLSLMGSTAVAFCPNMFSGMVISFWAYMANGIVFTVLNNQLNNDLKKQSEQMKQDFQLSQTSTSTKSQREIDRSSIVDQLTNRLITEKTNLRFTKRRRDILLTSMISFWGSVAGGGVEAILKYQGQDISCRSQATSQTEKIAGQILSMAGPILGLTSGGGLGPILTGVVSLGAGEIAPTNSAPATDSTEGKKGLVGWVSKSIKDGTVGIILRMVLFGGIAVYESIAYSDANKMYNNQKNKINKFESLVNESIAAMLGPDRKEIDLNAAINNDANKGKKIEPFDFDITESKYIPAPGYCFKIENGLLAQDSSCDCKKNHACATIPENPDMDLGPTFKKLKEAANKLANNEPTENPFYKEDLDKLAKDTKTSAENSLGDGRLKDLYQSTQTNLAQIKSDWEKMGKSLDLLAQNHRTIASTSEKGSDHSNFNEKFKKDEIYLPKWGDIEDKKNDLGGIHFQNPATSSEDKTEGFNNDIRNEFSDVFKSISGRYQQKSSLFFEIKKTPTSQPLSPNNPELYNTK